MSDPDKVPTSVRQVIPLYLPAIGTAHVVIYLGQCPICGSTNLTGFDDGESETEQICLSCRSTWQIREEE